MSGCLDYNVFAALLDGTLSAPERQQTLSHIRRCASCRAMAVDLGYEVRLDPALAATGLSDEDSDAGGGQHPTPRVADLVHTAASSGDDHPAVAAGAAGAALAPTAPSPEGSRQQQQPDADEPIIGRLIAGYRVKREIGSGGMGAVYEAVHERMGQRAAVKFMFPRFSQDPSFIRRFRAEARAASVVRHPGLVTIFNHGQLPDGTAYIMMEYLEGESLRRRMQGQRLSIADTLRLARQIASALYAVHQHGIVHRDLKPANLRRENLEKCEPGRSWEHAHLGSVRDAQLGRAALLYDL